MLLLRAVADDFPTAGCGVSFLTRSAGTTRCSRVRLSSNDDSGWCNGLLSVRCQSGIRQWLYVGYCIALRLSGISQSVASCQLYHNAISLIK